MGLSMCAKTGPILFPITCSPYFNLDAFRSVGKSILIEQCGFEVVEESGWLLISEDFLDKHQHGILSPGCGFGSAYFVKCSSAAFNSLVPFIFNE
jgi:hypothetical protein